MCGIAGLWERSGRPVDRPRSSGWASDPPPPRARRRRHPRSTAARPRNRRLAIIDLYAAGDQPMASTERGLWLIYNGEIHNYVELRRELEAHGHRFRSTPTPRSSCTPTSSGAPAASSASTGCGRSRSGTRASGGSSARATASGSSRSTTRCAAAALAFASEPKALLAAFPEEREPDRGRIDRFLAGGSPTRATRRSSRACGSLARRARCSSCSTAASRVDRLLGLRAGRRERRCRTRRSGSASSFATRCGCGCAATSRSAPACPAASTRARSRRSSMSRRSEPMQASRSATRLGYDESRFADGRGGARRRHALHLVVPRSGDDLLGTIRRASSGITTSRCRSADASGSGT